MVTALYRWASGNTLLHQHVVNARFPLTKKANRSQDTININPHLCAPAGIHQEQRNGSLVSLSDRTKMLAPLLG